MSDHGDWGKKRDAALFSQQAKNEEAMMNKVLESMRRAEAQTGYACDWEAAVKAQRQDMDARTKELVFHYEKLCKLEQLLRKRIKLYRDSPLDHPNDLQMHWRVQEGLYETLSAILKEAGLE